MRKLLALILLVALMGTVAAAQVKITIFADDTRTPLMRELGAQYTADTGVEIEVVEYASTDIRTAYVTATQAGEGPDIVIGAHDWLGEYVTNGLVEPLDLGDRAADFSQAALEAFTSGGTLYGMPYASENIALVYDKDIVPTAPRTWDELLAVCRAVSDPDVPMYGLAFQNQAGNFYQFFPMLSAAGGYIFGYDAEGNLDPCDVGLATDGAVFGASLYQSMLDEGLIPSGVDWDTLNALVAGKNAAMFITGPWLINAIRDAGINYGITQLPAIKGPNGAYNVPKVFMGVQGFMVNSFSPNKTIAMDFLLNYIATTDVMVELMNQGNRSPAYLPALSYAGADALAFSQQAAFGVPMPSIPAMASVWQEGGNALDLINNGTDPATALQQAKDLILAAVGCE